ncbi:MAG: hypothetical protein IJ341_07730 [Bacteroidales bacterium]|nr:hypothetical protein [Bacteroidales bacterium]
MITTHHYANTSDIIAGYDIKGKILSLAFNCSSKDKGVKESGGDVLLCANNKHVKLMNLPLIPLPEVNFTTLFPWRMVVYYINAIKGLPHYYPQQFIDRIGTENINLVENSIIDNKYYSCTSGVDSLFDAVASLIGVCDVNTYPGEAIYMLEHIASKNENARYPVNRYNPFDIKLLFSFLISDIDKGIDKSVISAKFHNTFAYMLQLAIDIVRRDIQIDNILLCGAIFQNKILMNLLFIYLREYNINLYYPSPFSIDNISFSPNKLFENK